MKHIMPLLQPLLDIPLQHIDTSWKESVEAISERLLSKDYSSAEEFVVEHLFRRRPWRPSPPNGTTPDF